MVSTADHHVAVHAEQSADGSGNGIVVNSEHAERASDTQSFRSVADGTEAILACVHRIVGFK